MSSGQDWPTTGFRDILEEYGFRILGRERRRSGPAPWWKALDTSGKPVYDPQARWTETHYTIRRNVTCEACGQRFGYNFEVDQISRMHQAGRRTDGALRRELRRQLRRRIRCPHCHAVQKEPRHTLLREDHRQTLTGCGLFLGGMLLVAGLGMLGGWLAGIVGFFVGLLLGLIAVLTLWFSAFPYIHGLGPTI